LLCITKNGFEQTCIEVNQIDGIYDREKNINEAEATAVFNFLVNNHESYSSIIVITFNAKQAELIENKIQVNEKLSNRLDDLSLKVRSLENVQGDEADLVVISTTFAKDHTGKFINNFGPINQFGGKNRINVMASRAKYKMIVFKSFLAEQITNTNNENTLIFKKFIAYVENYQSSNNSRSLNTNDNVIDSNFDILIKEIIQAFKDDPNLFIEVNKYVGTHCFDLSFSKKDSNKITLLLIIDDFEKIKSYCKDNSEFIRAMDRQRYYEDRGYKIVRINQIE